MCPRAIHSSRRLQWHSNRRSEYLARSCGHEACTVSVERRGESSFAGSTTPIRPTRPVSTSTECSPSKACPPFNSWRVPAHVTGPFDAIFEADADLAFVQLWWSDETPDAAFAPLEGPGGDRRRVELPADGPYVLRARLANQAYVEAAPSPLAAVTPQLEAHTVLDTTPPVIADVHFETSAGFVSSTELALTVRCLDLLTPSAEIGVEVDTGAGPAVIGAAETPFRVDLGAGDGARRLEIRCVDAAGHHSDPHVAELTVDTTPPVIDAFTLEDGAPDAPIGGLAVTAHVQATDATSGIAALAMAESELDCRRALYVLPAAETLSFLLTPGDGQRTLAFCARDRAGNVTRPAVSARNAVWLDTRSPIAPSVEIAHGARWTRTPDVPIRVQSDEPGLSLELAGAIEMPATYPSGAWPASVALRPGDGRHEVRAALIDAAGNQGPTVTSTIELDTEAPAAGRVVLASGQQSVRSRRVSITIADSAADTMRFWEVSPGEPCGEPSCADGFSSFAPSSELTVSKGRGDKQLCWRLCDAAGNATAVGSARLTLGTYVPRPEPVVERTQPRGLAARIIDDAAAPTTVIVHGRGLAADTRARIGDVEVPCPPLEIDAADCQADAAGGCGDDGRCAATCATRCELAVPAAVLRNAGTYLLRLITPAPVESGTGVSAGVGFVDVVAPIPRLTRIAPRGLRLGGGADATALLSVEGCDLVDNAQFRLGQRYGEVTGSTAPTGDGRCEGRGWRRLDVRFPVETLTSSDLDDASITAVNPSPGGGESSWRFGVPPRAASCPLPCLSNLRWTRPNLPGLDWPGQSFVAAQFGSTGVLGWRGGTAATLRDADGRPLTRLTAESAGGHLPFLLTQVATMTFEDAVGTGPQLRLDHVAALGDGAFGPEIGRYPTGRNPVSLAAGDLDSDGIVDLVTANQLADGVTVFRGDGEGGFFRPVDWPVGNAPTRVRLADLDADGHLDLVVAIHQSADPDVDVSGLSFGLGIRLGRGDGRFEPPTRFETGGLVKDLQVADADRDGWPDAVVATFGDVYLLSGRVDGAMGAPRPLGDGALAGIGRLAVGDLDGAGRLDVVVSHPLDDRISVLSDAGDGYAITASVLVGDEPHGLAVGDLDGDGAADVVVAEYRGDAVTWLPGLGNGQLGAPHTWPGVRWPEGIALVAEPPGPAPVRAATLVVDGWFARP